MKRTATIALVMALGLTAAGCGNSDPEKPAPAPPGGLAEAISCLENGGATITGQDQNLRGRSASVAARGPDGSLIALYTAPRPSMPTLRKMARNADPRALIHQNLDRNALASLDNDATIIDWTLALECVDRLPRKVKDQTEGPPAGQTVRTARYTAMFEQICGFPVGKGEDQLLDMAVAGGEVTPKQLKRRVDAIPRNVALNARRDPAGTCRSFRWLAGMDPKLPNND